MNRIAGVLKLDPPTIEVEETDDVGVWVQVQRKTGPFVLPLRWEFILGIELPVDIGKVVGLKG